jgi:hypothetical protein
MTGMSSSIEGNVEIGQAEAFLQLRQQDIGVLW